jgi:hypothetical protein
MQGNEGMTPWRSYELNLILDDPDEPRLNLATHTSLINLTAWNQLKWTRQAAKQLAGFLQVPLLDLIPPGAS